MKDTILANIQQDDDYYFTQIPYLSNTIEIIIDPEDKPLKQSTQIVQELILSIEKFDTLSKEILARDLLDTYNDNWSSYDETQDDGTRITITNPTLSKKEFMLNLTLNQIIITGEKSISMGYDDSDMFWGHQPTVTSHDGLDFSNAKADI